ncbi:DUF1284 domain-containing protein [Candidatus Pyrohabitans sp.]
MRIVRLRPHHMMCLLNFGGEGYSSEFVRNFWEILECLELGSEMLVVEGGDDICRACPHFAGECRMSEKGEVFVRGLDRRALEKLGLKKNEVLDLKKLVEKVLKIPEKELAEVCSGCIWLRRCYSQLFKG